MTAAGEQVRLRDGSVVWIRPLAPDDKALLPRVLEGLSPESRYRRFFSPKPSLSRRELAFLTDVDHRGREALIATVAPAEPVAVGRYGGLPEDPATAEVAVAVIDEWQGRGLATALLTRLAERARRAGFERFKGVCLAYNHEAVDVLAHLGPARVRHGDPGLLEVELDLADLHTLMR